MSQWNDLNFILEGFQNLYQKIIQIIFKNTLIEKHYI
jgi:hypothetical protein